MLERVCPAYLEGGCPDSCRLIIFADEITSKIRHAFPDQGPTDAVKTIWRGNSTAAGALADGAKQELKRRGQLTQCTKYRESKGLPT